MADYDVIVIGGGSAGTSAARTASDRGKRTLLINDGELGGLCILRGCMPTKAMLASAHLMHDVRLAEPLGLRFDGRLEADFKRIMERKDRLVARFQRAKIASIRNAGYDVTDARARFGPNGAVEIDGRTLTANGYVIATGSAPILLPLPGIDSARVLTSDSVMRLDRQPSSLVVQGAGAVGLELAQFFARIGTSVTLVNRSPLLSHYDLDAGRELHDALEDEPNLDLLAPAAITGIDPAGDRTCFVIEHAGRTIEVEAEYLLMAAGRRPAIEDLGLDRAGIRVDRGRIVVDECLRTTNPSVYVAGDALGTFQILHLANMEGRVAGANAAGAKPPRDMNYRLKMECIFTDPPFAYVGMTDVDAEWHRDRWISATARFTETGRAITMEVGHGAWKMFADRKTGQIAGSCIVGPRADDLIHVVASIMAYGGRVRDLFEMPWYHPTLSEVILELARDLDSKLGDGRS